MRLLNGHTKEVRDAKFLPDGRLLSVSTDKTARLWNLTSGNSKIIHRGKGPLYSLAISKNARIAAIGGRCGTIDNPLRQYDLETGSLATKFESAIQEMVSMIGNHDFLRSSESLTRSIWSISFCHEDRYLAISGRVPGAVILPNPGGGSCLFLETPSVRSRPFTESHASYPVRFAPDRHELAITLRGGVRFYGGTDFKYTVQMGFFFVSRENVSAIEYIPNSRLVAVAAGANFYLLDNASKKKPKKFTSSIRKVTALAASPNGRYLLLGGKPGKIEVWDLRTENPERKETFDFEIGGVHGLCVSPDMMTFAIAGEKGLAICDFEI